MSLRLLTSLHFVKFLFGHSAREPLQFNLFLFLPAIGPAALMWFAQLTGAFLIFVHFSHPRLLADVVFRCIRIYVASPKNLTPATAKMLDTNGTDCYTDM